MLTKYNRTIVASNSGAVVPEAVVEFRYQFTGALAPVYSDVNGTNAILNPTTADENGFVGVFLNPGIYRIIARQVPGGVPLQDLTYELVVNSTVADPQALSALGLNPHGIENISILFEPEAEGLYVNVASRLGAPFSNENYSTVAFRTPGADQDSSYVIVQINNPLEVLLDNSVDFGIGATGQQWMFVYLVWDGDEVHIGVARKTIHDEGVDHTTLDFSSNDVDRILTDGAISTPCTIRLVGRFVATRSSGNWSSVLTPSSYQSETTFITQEARKLLGDYGDFQFSGNLDIDGTISSGGSLVLTEDQVGVPGGVASLNSNGQVPSGQLPSYVDDVLEFADFASLPTTGETGKIYITVDNNEQYRWTGSTYVKLVASPGTTDNVPEGSTNLYFTQSRVRSTPLTGFVAGVGLTAVLATDTVLQAFQKLQGWLNGLGTAALANVTTSASDTTSGRVWRTNDLVKTTSAIDTTSGSVPTVGWMGMGTHTPPTQALASITNTGIFVAAAGDADNPMSSTQPYINFNVSTNYGGMIMMGRSNVTTASNYGVKYRTKNGGTFNDWQTFWDTGNLVKTTSPRDMTAGRMLQVGAGGLLGTSGLETNVTPLNDYPIANGFINGSGMTDETPLGVRPMGIQFGATAGNIVQLGGGSNVGPDLRFRKKIGASWAGPFTFWHSGNLTLTTGPTDTTAGRVLTVGSGGWLGLANYQSTYDFDATGQVMQGRTMISVSPGTKPSANIPGFPDNCFVLPAQRSSGGNMVQLAIAFEGSYSRMAHRHYSGSSWSPWVESWTTGNLVKTTSATDATAGSMLKVGDGGLLSSSIPINDWLSTSSGTMFNQGNTAGPLGVTNVRGIKVVVGSDIHAFASRSRRYWALTAGPNNGNNTAWDEFYTTGNTSVQIQDFLASESVWQSLANLSSSNTGYINTCINAAIQADPDVVKSIRQTLLTAHTSMFDTFNGGQLVKTNNSSYNVTLETDASLPLPIGFNVTVINDGSAGNITIVRDTGVVMRMAGNATDSNRVIAPYGQATLIKIATNTWRIVGVGVS